MTVLATLIERIRSEKQKGISPVVVLDLDDTLIDCRHRKLAIMNELANDPLLLRQYPHLSQLKALELMRIQYRVQHTLSTVGLHATEVIEAATQFWIERNFTNHYLHHDRPFAGAVKYVQALVQEGATIIYLSARIEQDMGEGTRKSLKKLGFPMGDAHRVWLKEDRARADFSFKEDALRELAQHGHVSAFFENEIPHLNLAADIFPGITLVWLDTLYAPNPPAPHARIHRITGFSLGTFG